MSNRFDDEQERIDAKRLRAILDACAGVRRHRGDTGVPPEVSDAWNYWQLIKIGEAARTLSSDARDAMPGIPWHQVIGTRNRLIHEYWRIDPLLISHIVKGDVDVLAKVVEQYLADKEDE